MESSFSHEKVSVQLDPTAFVADPELIRALQERVYARPLRHRPSSLSAGRPGRWRLHPPTGRSQAQHELHDGRMPSSRSRRCRFRARPSGTRQQSALLAHGGCPRRSAGKLRQPRRFLRDHGVATRHFLSKYCRFSPPKFAPPARPSFSEKEVGLRDMCAWLFATCISGFHRLSSAGGRQSALF